MVCKRIIPCLDVKDGEVVKGTNFINLISAGSIIELSKKYSDEGADELVFLDITATEEKRKTMLKLVEQVAEVINIPFTIGGGISNIKDFEALFKAGADKISLNSSIVKNPDLITEASKQFGSQAITASIDVKQINNSFKVFVNGGKVATDLDALTWCQKVEEKGAGEILLTSMDKDGTKNGYDIDFLKLVKSKVRIPVIASGGAGSKEHFLEAFTHANADACLAASLFHFNELSIIELKKYLQNQNINVRL